MIHKFIGDDQSIGDAPLATMRKRGGTWAAYQNHDLGHPEAGSMKFLQIGEGCTYPLPPERLPDTTTSINWRYLHVGYVDLATGGVVVLSDGPPKAPDATA